MRGSALSRIRAGAQLADAVASAPANLAIRGIGNAARLGSKTLRTAGGAAARTLEKISDAGRYEGTAAELVNSLKNQKSQVGEAGQRHLNAIADRLDALDPNYYIELLDDADFVREVSRHGEQKVDSVLAYFSRQNGKIYLRRSRGENLLEDLLHEGTHSLDFGRNGMFESLSEKSQVG